MILNNLKKISLNIFFTGNNGIVLFNESNTSFGSIIHNFQLANSFQGCLVVILELPCLRIRVQEVTRNSKTLKKQPRVICDKIFNGHCRRYLGVYLYALWKIILSWSLIQRFKSESKNANDNKFVTHIPQMTSKFIASNF